MLIKPSGGLKALLGGISEQHQIEWHRQMLPLADRDHLGLPEACPCLMGPLPHQHKYTEARFPRVYVDHPEGGIDPSEGTNLEDRGG